MYDHEEQFEEIEEELTDEEKESNATKKIGQTAAHITADYLTAGAYERVRNAPVVGQMAQKGEEIIGNKLEKQGRLSGVKKEKRAQQLDNAGILDTTNNPMKMSNNQEKSLTSPNTTSNIENNSSKNENSSNGSTSLNSNSPSISTKLLKRKTKVLFLISSFLIVIVVFIMLIAIISNNDFNSSGGLAINGYYSMTCDEVTVIFVDKNYQPTHTATYPIEEYVAGVVVGEVAYLGSYEVDKAFAVAARTFFAAHAEGNGCTIESSDRYQVFNETKNESATKAAEETKGQVLLSGNQLLSSIQYDAFACIDEDENYYTISQANQKVPKEWINAKIDKNNPKLAPWFICNGKENLQNHHGNGMSQFGALYLATEQDYKYDQILKFYLGDNVTISSNYITSIAGLDVKTTTRARNTLNEPISEFLSAKGSNLDQYNNFIKGSVESAGFGTRAGVVTAAVSMINFLYDNFNTKLPYYWGGQAQQYGLPASIGRMQNSATSPGGYTYYYKSFDCSGFVSWAIKNGGYKLSRLTTRGFDSSFSGDSCNIKDSNCIGQPGDLINSKSCHVQMIVSVDEASGKYYVAESTGEGVIMRQWGMHQGNCNSDVTKILHMDSYYNNQNNVDN